jgi:hypothetical protein
MREPEMVGPEGGTGTSRGGHAVAPISNGAYRGRLCADNGRSSDEGNRRGRRIAVIWRRGVIVLIDNLWWPR